MSPTSNAIPFRLIYKSLPHTENQQLEIGLQTKKGEIVAGEATGTNDYLFSGELKFQLKPNQAPDFSGPMVQGSAGARFLYLSWKYRNPETQSAYFWRVKIPLAGIDAAMLQSPEGAGLEADISGRQAHDTKHQVVWKRA